MHLYFVGRRLPVRQPLPNDTPHTSCTARLTPPHAYTHTGRSLLPHAAARFKAYRVAFYKYNLKNLILPA